MNRVAVISIVMLCVISNFRLIIQKVRVLNVYAGLICERLGCFQERQ